MSPSPALLAKLAAIILGAGVLATCASSPTNPEPRVTGAAVRLPAVAGAFYPGDPDELRSAVRRYLQQAEPTADAGKLIALIVPHAGYVYSGPVAAYAYRQLQSKRFDSVVVIGPSHRYPFTGIALSGADRWKTPLGDAPLDTDGREALMKAVPKSQILDRAHANEHSIEVQLPFLQVVLEDIHLLPVLIGQSSREDRSALAQALASYADQRSVLLVASSDMSHYPSYADAVRVDRETLDAINTLDPGEVEKTTRKLLSERTANLSTCLCGEAAVETVLVAARKLGAERAEVLRYANSGDIPGSPRDRVVGYCAVAIYGPQSSPAAAEPQSQGELTPPQQQRLLALARTTIEQYLRTGRPPEVNETDPVLLRPGAAFVTLTQSGRLRGCIGNLEPTASLAQVVRDNAVSAATRDPRFPPVRPTEVPHLEIEISLLSPLQKVARPEDIELGKHGVIVESGRRRGVFLPQVADETGWGRDEFLTRLCRDKAGLPPDAWKRGATLYVFTVQTFSSPAPGEQQHAQG
jgi:AmmeMemoRadiSam system protein B/AmmeMemoRadiSam system protein A